MGAFFVAVLSIAQIASARQEFSIPNARPTSIREVKEALRGGGEKESIPEYLDAAQCGGWDKTISIGDKGAIIGNYIPAVIGVPGRTHWWAGDMRSGMGARYDDDDEGNDVDDQYSYPANADGLATACEKDRTSIQKNVWEWKQWWESYDPVTWQFIEWVPEFEVRAHNYQYPEIHDPACRWRMEGNRWPDFPLTPDADPVQWDQDSLEYEEPPSCQEFCTYLNSFVYRDCLDPYLKDFWTFNGWADDGTPIFVPIQVWTCDPEDEGLKYICTDETVDEADRAVACDVPHPDIEEWSNARKCVGEQCRCGNGASDACVRIRDQEERAPYESYYRHYSGVSYSRAKLDARVPDDVATKSMDLACYGFYDEFDPKYHFTRPKDRRCVINVDVENMRETQKGKGEYTEGNVVDKDPTDPVNQRPGGDPEANGVFDVTSDTWYKKLGRSFSFVNEKLFKDQYDGDLGNVYLAYDELDDGTQRATPQINDEQPLAESNLLRAFDDTGNPRAFTRWWQSQQTRMAAIMRPPVLRIVLPSAWFMGLDPNDPFLAAEGGGTVTKRANRSDRIELQVEADEDVLGTVLAYLERSVLLHTEEEPIPVVVPMGSPTEFRARAGDWCEWYKAETGEKNCDNAPEDVKSVIKRLEEYADRIDDVRALRAELANVAGATLRLQRDILEPIAAWFNTNEAALKELVQNRERAEQDLIPLWERAHAIVRQMADRTNMPWCMNQRFTAPIYSLLDPWLPSRSIQQESGDISTSELNLPELPTIKRSDDVIVDFSALTTMSGTLKIPVLKPVQIRIDIPTPPTPRELPELPRIDDIRAAVQNAIGAMPTVENHLTNPPAQRPPAPIGEDQLNEARAALVRTEAIVRSMNERYAKFWGSIGPVQPLDPAQPNFEDLQREKERKERLRCKEWDTNQCQHVEMDLWERIQRIGSRPLVLLREDFESVGTRRTEATTCLPEDDACHILNPERTDPGFRWEISGSSANDAPIETMKMDILRLTQPPPLGTIDKRLLAPHDDDPSPIQTFPPIRLLP